MGEVARRDPKDAQAVTSPDASSTGEDRRKHLEFIQAVITRMATASSNTKSWLLPVVTAAYGYALTQRADSVAVLGLAAVAVFGLLDANYLRKEQEYRDLYNAAAGLGRAKQEKLTVPLFSMNPPKANGLLAKDSGWGHKLAQSWHCWVPGRSVWLSWSVAPFYGSLLVVGVAIYLRVELGEP